MCAAPSRHDRLALATPLGVSGADWTNYADGSDNGHAERGGTRTSAMPEVLPMAILRSFAFYYIRNALPFVTGVAFAVLALRADYAWYYLALAGLVLVVVGPLTIQFLLTLVVESLRGLPGEEGANRRKTTSQLGAPSLSRLGGPRVGSRSR
jgi:uncharacterized protein (DUF486 family)